MEQERLLIEAAQKDPGRFADLYENNFERVYAFIVRRVRDRHEAEDLTAEVFQHALANLPRFEWRGVPFAAWWFRIAANAIADRWQRISKEDPILFPTISIGPVGKRSNAAIFLPINVRSSSNVSSSKRVFARSQKNSAGPRAPS